MRRLPSCLGAGAPAIGGWVTVTGRTLAVSSRTVIWTIAFSLLPLWVALAIWCWAAVLTRRWSTPPRAVTRASCPPFLVIPPWRRYLLTASTTSIPPWRRHLLAASTTSIPPWRRRSTVGKKITKSMINNNTNRKATQQGKMEKTESTLIAILLQKSINFYTYVSSIHHSIILWDSSPTKDWHYPAQHNQYTFTNHVST